MQPNLLHIYSPISQHSHLLPTRYEHPIASPMSKSYRQVLVYPYFTLNVIPKGIEDACRRQANEAPEHRGTM